MVSSVIVIGIWLVTFLSLRKVFFLCVFPKCSASRKDKEISSFKIPTVDKTNDESIKWTKDLIDIILKYHVKDEALIKHMQSCKLCICERYFTPGQKYIYPTYKMLREGALLTLSLPREAASNTTKPHPANANKKHKEYQLLREQMPQLVYKILLCRLMISRQESRAMES